jgi:Cof subfamily protein (haloacid dehalogenase superfamily)
MTPTAARAKDVRLLLADVDGTLLTSARALAPATVRAARELRERGTALAITSSRPPRGMREFMEALAIDTPTGCFNGGAMVDPDLEVLARSPVPVPLVKSITSILRTCGLDVWVYSADNWYVLDSSGPHVEREQQTVRFAPTVVDSFAAGTEEVIKIVGVTDDAARMEAAERDVRAACEGSLSISRSQTYYLDVTHPDANKGNVVVWLSHFLGIPSERIAAIGDGPNDILMFRRSGLSIAMGNAGPAVQAEADLVTGPNDEDGFARAVETYILRSDSQGAG